MIFIIKAQVNNSSHSVKYLVACEAILPLVKEGTKGPQPGRITGDRRGKGYGRGERKGWAAGENCETLVFI